MSSRESDSAPDIEFSSTVEAERLHFREAPRTEVTFRGEPGRSSVKRSRRVNLPEPVEPGVEYRRVRVEYGFEVSIDLSGAAMEEHGPSAPEGA